MKLLLTNDDGIQAPGLLTLARVLSAQFEIYVAAPDRERSGAGHSISVFEPIKVMKADIPSAISAWRVSGTPADCVKLALEELIGTDIDFVIAGINHGPNLGTDVYYSGTFAAAAEGVILGCPAIAVSLNSYRPQLSDFEYPAHFILEFLKKIGTQGLEAHTLLNINAPPGDRESCQGQMVTKLGKRKYSNTFEARKDPRGQTYYWLGGKLRHFEQEQDSDVYAVQANYISITPIRLDITDYKSMEKYRKMFS